MNHSELSHMAGTGDDSTINIAVVIIINFSICRVTEATYCSCTGTRVTDRVDMQRPKQSLCPWTLTCNHTATSSPGVPFDSLHPPTVIHVNALITIHSPTTEEWKAELTQRTVYQEWSPVNHRSGKVRRPKTNVRLNHRAMLPTMRLLSGPNARIKTITIRPTINNSSIRSL